MLYNLVMKKILSSILLLAFMTVNVAAYSEVLEGHAEKTEEYQNRLQKSYSQAKLSILKEKIL